MILSITTCIVLEARFVHAALVPIPAPAPVQQPQTQTPSQTPTSTADAAKSEPVPLGDISKRLESSRRLLQELIEKPQPAEISEISGEIEATRGSFETEFKDAQVAIARSLRAEELYDLEISWKNRGARAAKWQALLSGWSSQLYKDLGLADQEEKTWELSLKSYAARSLPREVDRSIRDLLAQARKVKALIQKRLDALLVLENQLYQRQTSVSTILGNLSVAKERFRQGLAVADRVPLWEIVDEWERITPPLGGFSAILSRQFHDTMEFARTHSRKIGYLALGFLAALIVAVRMSRKFAHWTDERPDFKEATHFLRRPVSLTLFVALVPILLFLSGSAPRLVLSIGSLLLLFPLLRLVPPLIPPAARPVLYVVAGFYLFDSVRTLLLPVLVLDRIAFFVADLAAVVVIVWLFRPARLRRRAAESPTPRYLIIASRLVLLTLCVALVANLVGNFDLSMVLSSGTLYSIYTAFAFFGTATAISVVFAVLLDTKTARSLSIVRRYGTTISRWAAQIFQFAALVIWIRTSLNFFTIRDAIAGALNAFVTAPIWEGRINFSLLDVGLFVFVLAAAIMLARAVRLILAEDLFPRVRVSRGVPAMITTSVYYVLLFFGFLLAVSIAGVDINRFTLLAGAFGVGVGFGMQNIVNNFISGLILLFERPINTGDMVEVAGIQGVVKRIGIRSSAIATYEGADAIIPNATLISDKLLNWTLTNESRRVDVKVGVAYGSDLQVVMRILYDVASLDPDVRGEPAPQVLFQGFGDSALNFEIRFWVSHSTHVNVKSRVSMAVVQALRAAGIEIPFPQRDLHLKSMDERAASLVTQSEAGTTPRKRAG
jgi:small-conductance mechanosensitive channel